MSPPDSAIVEEARAKVNLTLRVLGRRTDGYHEIESLVAFANGAADRVTLLSGAAPSVRVVGPFAGGIASENLIATALRLVSEAEPRLRLRAVTLEKNLPVAAGIGGGSADAAAVLRALRRSNPALAGVVDWAAIAARLGADVPVCLLDRAAMMRGIGERLAPLDAVPPLPAVLVNPLAEVPDDKTAQVFRALAAAPLAGTARECPAPALAGPGDLLAFMRAHGNDLTDAAAHVVRGIRDVLAALSRCEGCRLARLSGAGPTCFGVFDTEVASATAERALLREHRGWWVKAVVLGG